MITKKAAIKRVAELRERVQQLEAEVEPKIHAISEAIESAAEAEVEGLIAEQDALLEEAGHGVDFLLGRIAELGHLFELDLAGGDE